MIATGMWVPNVPSFPGVNYTERYESISTNPRDYEGQSVLIIGESPSTASWLSQTRSDFIEILVAVLSIL